RAGFGTRRGSTSRYLGQRSRTDSAFGTDTLGPAHRSIVVDWSDLPVVDIQLPIAAASTHGHPYRTRSAVRCSAHAFADENHPERSIVHGCDHGDRCSCCKRMSRTPHSTAGTV